MEFVRRDGSSVHRFIDGWRMLGGIYTEQPQLNRPVNSFPRPKLTAARVTDALSDHARRIRCWRVSVNAAEAGAR